MSTGFKAKLSLLFLVSLLSHQVNAQISGTYDLLKITRPLTEDERSLVEDIAANEVMPMNEEAGQDLLQRLYMGRIRAWVVHGYGITQKTSGRIFVTKNFLTPEGMLALFKRESAQRNLDNKRLGIDLKSKDVRRKPYLFDPLIPYMELSPTYATFVQRQLLAQVLFHENFHCTQGKRALRIGATFWDIIDHLEVLSGAVDMLELEAYDQQINFATDLVSKNIHMKNRTKLDILITLLNVASEARMRYLR